ncbi:PREDICTED: uncharacterized protein LOC109340956 [Lupinus angustifolius]|uniref:uncharacterized protein LOC109340956 n=1 Tax=Lupinus angustifolius TaxID=3871 RepID=UPI00092F3B7F|nr:PREDICTED: uncharacterized protein LOC109340956 [Lupinus angustifolius]
MSSNSGPWSCIGDFNVVLGSHECRGPTLPSKIPLEDFQNFTEDANLIHLNTRGVDFTWTNKRRGASLTEKKLDRVLCNEDWISSWNQVLCCTLPRISFVHNPILFCSLDSDARRSSYFRFLKMWTSHPDCIRVILDAWKEDILGCPMFILVEKLKRLKCKLKIWNWNVFGNIHQQVKEALSSVDVIQACINDHGPTTDLLNQECVAQGNLLKALAMEEEFWREKSRLNWHSSGDRNTNFFHKITKLRQVAKSMSVIRDGDRILINQDDIANHALSYYQALFATPNNKSSNDLIQKVIPSMVSAEENHNLIGNPSLEEIKSVVFSLNGEGAPGPDGFGGASYQKYWDIVGTDVCNSVKQFFSQSWLLPNLNSNSVVLIPKTVNADKIEDFRPIALANFQFKIISKVLADRLAVIAARIISP